MYSYSALVNFNHGKSDTKLLQKIRNSLSDLRKWLLGERIILWQKHSMKDFTIQPFTSLILFIDHFNWISHSYIFDKSEMGIKSPNTWLPGSSCWFSFNASCAIGLRNNSSCKINCLVLFPLRKCYHRQSGVCLSYKSCYSFRNAMSSYLCTCW